MNTSDCTYHCNQTRSPVSQSNKRKATPREIKRPHMSDLTKTLVTVPPPVIYILSKNSPCSLNVQVELTSLTSLTSIHIHTPGFWSNWHVHKLEFCTETPT